jgi:hypothetical protein
MPLEGRTATLLAVVRTLEASAQDDVLDLFDIVVTTLFTGAAKVGKKAGCAPATSMPQPSGSDVPAACRWTTL